MKSDEMLIGKPDLANLYDSIKSPHAQPLTEKAAVTRELCSSSAPETTVGPSLAPAFLTEQRRGR